MEPATPPAELEPLVQEYQDLSGVQKSYFWKETALWMSAIFGTLMLDAFVLEIGVAIGLIAVGFFCLWMRSLNSEKSLFKGARETAQKLKEIDNAFAEQGLSVVNGPDGVVGVFKAE